MEMESVEEKEKRFIKDFSRHLDKNMREMLLVYVASNMMASNKTQSRGFLADWAHMNKINQKEHTDKIYDEMSEYDKNRSLSKERYTALFDACVKEALESWKDVLGLSTNIIMN